jgi:hypothetical protein
VRRGLSVRPSWFVIPAIDLAEQPLQVVDLRQIVDDDVRVAGIVHEEVLVVGLGREEGLVHLDFGDDGGVKDAGLVELADIGLGGIGLCGAGREDRRPVLRADIRPLAVQLGRVVRDREEDLQQLPIADLLWVEGHLDGLGVPGVAVADELVLRRLCFPAGIAGDRVRHAFDVLEDTLHAPETATGEDRRLGRGLSGWLVHHRRGDGAATLRGGRRKFQADEAGAQQQSSEQGRAAIGGEALFRVAIGWLRHLFSLFESRRFQTAVALNVMATPFMQ